LDNALVISPSVATPTGYVTFDMPLDGDVVATDAFLNRVWFGPATNTGTPLIALDGTSHAPLFAGPITLTGGAVVVAEVEGVLFIDGVDDHVRLFDAESGALLDDIDFPALSGGY